MAIFFRCQCGTSFNFPENLAGKLGRCKKCGNRITVPDPSQPKSDFPLTTVIANDNTQVVDENNSSSGVIATLTLCCFFCCLITAWWGYGQLGLAVQPQSSETQPSPAAARTHHSPGSLFTQSELEKARQVGIEKHREEMSLKEADDKKKTYEVGYVYWKQRMFAQWFCQRGTANKMQLSSQFFQTNDDGILVDHLPKLTDEAYEDICWDWYSRDGNRFREPLIKAEKAEKAAERDERFAELQRERRKKEHVYYQYTCQGCGLHADTKFAYGYQFDKVKKFKGEICPLCGDKCYFKELSHWQVAKIRRQKKADFDEAIGGDEDFKDFILEMNKKGAF